jgi:hypothetical protein
MLKNEKKRGGEGRALFLSRKPVATVSTNISLYFTETSISYSVLPHSLTTTLRTLNLTSNFHALSLLLPNMRQLSEGKKRGEGGYPMFFVGTNPTPASC